MYFILFRGWKDHPLEELPTEIRKFDSKEELINFYRKIIKMRGRENKGDGFIFRVFYGEEKFIKPIRKILTYDLI